MREHHESISARHCEPTGPARSGWPDDRLREAIQLGAGELDCFVASLLAMTAHFSSSPFSRRKKNEGERMRRKVSAANWRFPRRMTFTQWRRVPYRQKHWLIAQAQCDLLGYWRGCADRRCRRKRHCRSPHPCYWDHKAEMSDAQRAHADAVCKPLRDLMDIGSSRGAEGLWLF
jgi:hypothetical protein